MEDPNDTLQFEVDTLGHEIYENTENLPPNDQSVQYSDDNLDNCGKEDLNLKIQDNRENLPENLEESNTQTDTVYRVLENSHMKYSDCGEPSKYQHIKIDFTPVPGVDDNAFLHQKCVDFWKFVNEHPELQRFEAEKVEKSSANETIANRTNVDPVSSDEIESPAVQFLHRPDIKQKSLAAKLKDPLCVYSDKEYSLGETEVEQRLVNLKKRSQFTGPKSNLGFKSRSSIKNKSTIIKSSGHEEVNKLCRKMEEWDLSHPKSMEPPKRVPSSKYLN